MADDEAALQSDFFAHIMFDFLWECVSVLIGCGKVLNSCSL